MRLVLYYRYGNKRQEKGYIVETKRERYFSENQSLVPAIHSCSNLRIAAHDVYIIRLPQCNFRNKNKNKNKQKKRTPMPA